MLGYREFGGGAGRVVIRDLNQYTITGGAHSGKFGGRAKSSTFL
jgi:hypothetical protein